MTGRPGASLLEQVEGARRLLRHPEEYGPGEEWLARFAMEASSESALGGMRFDRNGCLRWNREPGPLTLGNGHEISPATFVWCMCRHLEPRPGIRLRNFCGNPWCVLPEHHEDLGQLEDFFAAGTRTEGGCLLWPGAGDGYGATAFQGKTWRTHVLTYRWLRGEVPGLAQVCHRCDTRACYAPSHLFLSDHDGNMRDRDQKGRAARGARHPRSRHDAEQARKLLGLVLNYGMPVAQASRVLKMSSGTADAMLAGQHWAVRDNPSLGHDIVVTGQAGGRLDEDPISGPGEFVLLLFDFWLTDQALLGGRTRRVKIGVGLVCQRADTAAQWAWLLGPEREMAGELWTAPKAVTLRPSVAARLLVRRSRF
jgi:hypothetical protein